MQLYIGFTVYCGLKMILIMYICLSAVMNSTILMLFEKYRILWNLFNEYRVIVTDNNNNNAIPLPWNHIMEISAATLHTWKQSISLSCHQSLHLLLMSSLTFSPLSPYFPPLFPSLSLRLSCVIKLTLAWTRCVIGNFRVSPALPLNDNLISPAAGPVSNDHLHLHLEWLAKGDREGCVCVCVEVQGVW